MNTIQVARFIVGFSWIYHGIFPKLLHVAPLELRMTATIGLSEELSLLLTRAAGVSEAIFGIVFICFYRSKFIIYTNILALVSLLIFVAIQLPEVLIEAFNPVTTNIPIIGLSFILLTQLDAKNDA